MFVLQMGVNQSSFVQLSYYHHLPSIPPDACSSTSLPLHFFFNPDSFLLRAVIIAATYGRNDRISIPEV
jgi:hypothetical protein